MTDLARERAIVEVLDRHSGRFQWGTRDCVTLVVDVVTAIRGQAPLVPTWCSADEADEELERRGGLRAGVSAVLGPPMDFATEGPSAGDPCLVRMREYEFMGIWANGRVIAPAENGLRRVDPRHVVAAWKI